MNGRVCRRLVVVAFIVCVPAAVGWAQQTNEESKSPAAPPAAAFVNGKPVYVASVLAKYNEIAKRKALGAQYAPRGMADVLTQLINRSLVISALERDKALILPRDIERQMEQLTEQVKKERGQSLQQFAQSTGVDVDALRREIVWQLGWERYLDRHLVDALEQYFNKHKRELDGTQVRASHVLLRPGRYNETTAQIVDRANKIREEIESGKTTFEEAAAKHSAGPSRTKGGDLGFISRHGSMLPEFASTAFELKPGEISEPVTTAFGTHLIRVTEVKPGRRQWTEVIPQIKALASADVFTEVADRELKKADVKFTGRTPYIDPETEELIVPRAPKQAASK